MEASANLKNILTKENISDFTLIILGCILQAIGMAFFLIPANLISGGISGLAQVVNHYTGWPIGVMTFLGNLPLFIIGWKYLGKFSFAIRTVTAVVLFSALTDLIFYVMPNHFLTHDIFLNTLFGAVIMGAGFGLVYRGSGTSGGTDIIIRIMNQRLSMPITQSYMLTDIGTVALGAIAFGWDLGLYGMVAIYISGVAAEMVSEGSGVFRDVMIVTDEPDILGQSIIEELGHSVTFLKGVGGYSGAEKKVVYCVINRSEVNRLKKLVVAADPNSFMVVGTAHEVLGEGFQRYKNLG